MIIQFQVTFTFWLFILVKEFYGSLNLPFNSFSLFTLNVISFVIFNPLLES